MNAGRRVRAVSSARLARAAPSRERREFGADIEKETNHSDKKVGLSSAAGVFFETGMQFVRYVSGRLMAHFRARMLVREPRPRIGLKNENNIAPRWLACVTESGAARRPTQTPARIFPVHTGGPTPAGAFHVARARRSRERTDDRPGDAR